ncbi:MAG: Na+/H+ antiporter subunit E [Burkholderiales bacterium]|nr:Na+/H+ antiporter subunit E [Burkholderiales bacterium]
MRKVSVISTSSALLILCLRFVGQVVWSGIVTARLILSPDRCRHAGLVRMSFGDLSPPGIAILGCMITLTPGTTTLDIDMDRREMLLHMLDARAPQQAIDAIRNDFEKYLLILFPGRSETP